MLFQLLICALAFWVANATPQTIKPTGNNFKIIVLSSLLAQFWPDSIRPSVDALLLSRRDAETVPLVRKVPGELAVLMGNSAAEPAGGTSPKSTSLYASASYRIRAERHAAFYKSYGFLPAGNLLPNPFIVAI